MKVVWEGSFFVWHSLAHVNRELASRLAKLKSVDAIKPSERDLGSALVFPGGKQLKSLVKSVKGPALSIRHAFPPNFTPNDGPVVLMQPWEFLRAPEEWVQAVRQGAVQELWCNSNFTRNAYVQSGVPAERVRVLPLGFDERVFNVEQPRTPYDPGSDGAEFTFLYVGGTIERKGIDILMRAFLEEFRRSDPVRLIVKDSGTKHVYIHNNQREPILKVVNDPNAPRVTYIEDDLSPQELSKLMRSCDCIVQPYRAEGFCLPVLEGMACGLATIVTFGGPTDDLVLHSCGWKVASQRVQIAQLPGLESRDDQGWLEPDQADVQRALREAFENPKLTTEMGQNAAQIAKLWGWDTVAADYSRRIAELKERAKAPHAMAAKRAMRQTLSCCMIAKNEERCIAEALASVKDFVDELIVTDTGSTDSTVEIAKAHGAIVRHFKWVNSFSAARNDSTQDATGDWILWIDCDDTVSPETMAAIRAAIEDAPDEVWGLVLPVRFNDGTQVDHVKVYRNKPALNWQFRIHEQILGPIRQIGGEIGHINGVHVLHKNYDTSPEGQTAKRKRDWKLLNLDLKENPDHPFVLFNCGMTAQNVGQYKKAIPLLIRCLELSTPADSIYRKTYDLLALSYKGLKERQKARETFLAGLDVLPGDPEMLYHLAQLEHEDGNLQRAAELYRAIDSAVVAWAYTSFDHGLLGFKRLHNLGNVELELGNYLEARESFIAALKDRPEHTVSAMSLFQAALNEHDADTAKAMHNHVLQVEDFSWNWIEMLKHIVPDLEPHLRQILVGRPDSVPVRLELSRFLLAAGRESEALPHLQLLANQGVAEAAFHLGTSARGRGLQAEALKWFQRALELNPGHEQTMDELTELD
ncbi:MAG: glycosyltransferase [Methanoregulaceae archaeon]|nr:glycosyltransferase [Methanoregulaceae archaeon]